MSDRIYSTPGVDFESIVDNALRGLVGVAGVTITDLDDNIVQPRTVDGIAELDAGIAAATRVRYRYRGPAPAAYGTYLVVWDDGAGNLATEPDRLIVNYTGAPFAPEAGNDAIATLAELRRYEPLDDAARYPDDLVLGARDALIEALEHECKTAFVRRVRTETFDDHVPMRAVALTFGTSTRRHRGPTITAASVNGIAVDLALTPLGVGAGGLVRRRYGAFGHEASITYEYGYDAPPGRVKRAVCLGVADWLAQELDSPIPDRATSWSTDAGTFAVVTAGARGAVFSLPELNAVVLGYAE